MGSWFCIDLWFLVSPIILARAPTSKSISLPHAQEDSQSRWVEDSDSDEDEEYSNFTDEKSR